MRCESEGLSDEGSAFLGHVACGSVVVSNFTTFAQIKACQ